MYTHSKQFTTILWSFVDVKLFCQTQFVVCVKLINKLYILTFHFFIMDKKNKEMSESLIQWFQGLNLQSPHSNTLELSDGVAMAQALNQIAPDTFTGRVTFY